MRILLVDDNPTDVAQSLEALRARGLACSVVVDGFRVLEEMRRRELLKRIPVVALCCSAEEALRAITGEARANDCLVKPLTPSDLDGVEQRLSATARPGPGAPCAPGP